MSQDTLAIAQKALAGSEKIAYEAPPARKIKRKLRKTYDSEPTGLEGANTAVTKTDAQVDEQAVASKVVLPEGEPAPVKPTCQPSDKTVQGEGGSKVSSDNPPLVKGLGESKVTSSLPKRRKLLDSSTVVHSPLYQTDSGTEVRAVDIDVLDSVYGEEVRRTIVDEVPRSKRPEVVGSLPLLDVLKLSEASSEKMPSVGALRLDVPVDLTDIKNELPLSADVSVNRIIALKEAALAIIAENDRRMIHIATLQGRVQEVEGLEAKVEKLEGEAKVLVSLRDQLSEENKKLKEDGLVNAEELRKLTEANKKLSAEVGCLKADQDQLKGDKEQLTTDLKAVSVAKDGAEAEAKLYRDALAGTLIESFKNAINQIEFCNPWYTFNLKHVSPEHVVDDQGRVLLKREKDGSTSVVLKYEELPDFPPTEDEDDGDDSTLAEVKSGVKGDVGGSTSGTKGNDIE